MLSPLMAEGPDVIIMTQMRFMLSTGATPPQSELFPAHVVNAFSE